MKKPQLDMTVLSDREALIIELDSVADAVDALRDAFKCAQRQGMNKADLSRITGRNASYVTKLLNGKLENFTVRTLGLFMRALGHRMEIVARPEWEIVDRRNGTIDDVVADIRVPQISGVVTVSVKASAAAGRLSKPFEWSVATGSGTLERAAP